jgi:hypothetical protein
MGLLDTLGYSAFNISLGEAKTYLMRGAMSATEIWNRLKGCSIDTLAWGDIYATTGSRIPDSGLFPKLPSRRLNTIN